MKMAIDLPLLTQVRYLALDEVFSYEEGERLPEPPLFKEDLLRHVNKRLREADKAAAPIAMRTLEKDIQDLQAIYGVRVKKLSRAKRAYYCYAEAGMRIRRNRLRAGEWTRLQRCLTALEEVAPQDRTGGLRETIAKLRWQFGGSSSPHKPDVSRWVQGEGDLGKYLDFALEALTHGLHVRFKVESWDPPSQLFEGYPLMLTPGPVGWKLWGVAVSGDSAVGGPPHDGVPFWGISLCDISDWNIQDRTETVLPSTLFSALQAAQAIRVQSRTSSGFLGRPEAEEIRVWFAEDAFHSEKKLAGLQPIGKPEASAGGKIWTFQGIPDLDFVRAVFSYAGAGQILEPFSLRDLAKQELAILWKGYGKMFGP
jgi:hypothetical protein